MPPTKPYTYRREYAEQLIEHMKKGKSFSSFAAVIRVKMATMHNWLKIVPEFAEAKEFGEAEYLLMMENAGMNAMFGKIKNFNTKVWELNMKNRANWSEKHEVTETGGDGATRVTLYLPDNGRSNNGGQCEKGPEQGEV